MQHRVCLYYKIPEIGEKLQHTESMPCVFFKYIFMLNYLWIYSSVHLYCIHIVVPNSCDSVQLNLSQMMLNLAKHMVLRLLWLQLRYLQKRTSYTFMYRVLWTVLLLLLFFFLLLLFFCFVFVLFLLYHFLEQFSSSVTIFRIMVSNKAGCLHTKTYPFSDPYMSKRNCHYTMFLNRGC